MSEYMPEVVQAVPGEGRSVYAYFTDGTIHLYDVAPLIEQGGVFAQLEDEAFFRDRLTVLNSSVAWDVSGHYDPTTCIDIDPFEVYAAQTVSDPLEDVR
jgi:hypothetical protein